MSLDGNPALAKVKLPAIFMIVAAVIGVLYDIFAIVQNLFLGGMQAAQAAGGKDDPTGGAAAALGGVVGVIFIFVWLLLHALIIFGAVKMMSLQNYGLAMAAAVISVIPCISPCCVLGIPFGIWALIVLMSPDVKTAFR